MSRLAWLPETFAPGVRFTIPLWGQRSSDWLKREYRKGRWSFERGFRQNAPREEDRRFGDLSQFLLYGIKVDDFFPEGSKPVVYGAYDPAGSKRLGNALVSGALHAPSSRRIITGMDLWRGSGKTDATRIALGYERWRWPMLVVENNGTQQAFNDLIVQATNGQLAVAPFITGKNKADLDIGIPGLETQVRNGLWALCMDDEYDTGEPLSQHDVGCGCAYHVFLEDLNNYPSPARTCDLMMAWWFLEGVFRGVVRVPESGRSVEDELNGDIPANELAGNMYG